MSCYNSYQHGYVASSYKIYQWVLLHIAYVMKREWGELIHDMSRINIDPDKVLGVVQELQIKRTMDNRPLSKS